MAADEMAKRLEHHKRNILRETREAEELEAQAQTIKANIIEKQLRLQAGVPERGACPDCWVERGEVNPMISAPSDDPTRSERMMRCSARCGYSYDVPAA